MKKNPKIIIGFVGKMCSGKGEAIKYLVEKYEFTVSSCSDRVREEIRRSGREITRDNLHQTAGNLRKEFGAQVLAERTWEQILGQKTERAAIDSIRAIEEVEFLKTLPNFYLIALEANQKLRFERITKRVISGQADPTTWEAFVKSEERDNTGDGRNIEACIKLADFHIKNETTKNELYSQLDKIMSNLPT
jgi:dephospho-CoA kinase